MGNFILCFQQRQSPGHPPAPAPARLDSKTLASGERIRIWSVSHIPLTDSFMERGILVGSKNHPSILVRRPLPSIFHELVERLSTLHLSSGISSKRATIRRVVAGGQLLRSDLAVHATLAISRCAVMRDRAAIVKMERGGRGARRWQTDRKGNSTRFACRSGYTSEHFER